MIQPVTRTIRGLVEVLTGHEGRHKHERKVMLQSFKAKANSKRSVSELFADSLTAGFGSVFFLIFNILLFIAWIYVNTSPSWSMYVFDPYPFTFLTLVVSLEAIILSIFVLMSQNRSTRLDDIREELHLQINLIAETEITKAVEILAKLAEKQGIDLSQDKALQKILKPLSQDSIEKHLEKEIK